MKILLDTHVALWAIADSGKLPAEIAEMISDRRNTVHFSVASVWEVAIKRAIRPEAMPLTEEQFVDLCARTGFACLGIEPRHVYAVKTLARPDDAPRHNDPFDRLLIAQAKAEGLSFVTHDALLPGYGEGCVRFF